MAVALLLHRGGRHTSVFSHSFVRTTPWGIEPVCSEQAHHTDRTAPLAGWLEWAQRYIQMADPLGRFRQRRDVVSLYVSGYGNEIARMRTQGFEDPDPPTYEPEKACPPGIRLQDVKFAKGWMTEALEIDLPEELVLPYEVTKPGYVPRTLYVPAKVLNEALGNANAKHP